MEKTLASAPGQDVSKLAVQEKRLLLSCLLARLVPEIRNRLSLLDSPINLRQEGDGIIHPGSILESPV